jgi:hypothetical protein
MKNFLLLFFFLLWISSNAQITIYQQDLPQPGDTFKLYVDKTPTVSLGNASASSQNWDYGSLNIDSTKWAPYGITSNLPFAASFLASNSYTYGPAMLYGGPGAPSPGAGIGYTMWAVNNTGMWVVGHRSNYDGQGEKNVFINPMEMLMPVPCTYPFNQTYDSKWEVAIDYISTDLYDTLYRSRTHKTINCDAWGSMTTPFGTFPNIIRVHETSVTTDSVFLYNGPITVYSSLYSTKTINKYLFWAPNQRHPVAIAYCDNAGVLQRIEYVSWANLNVPEITNKEPSVSVFPNPVSDYITIKISDSFKNKNYTLRIFDVSGNEIYKQICKSDENAISVKGFDKGLYFVEILTEQGKTFNSNFVVN